MTEKIPILERRLSSATELLRDLGIPDITVPTISSPETDPPTQNIIRALQDFEPETGRPRRRDSTSPPVLPIEGIVGSIFLPTHHVTRSSGYQEPYSPDGMRGDNAVVTSCAELEGLQAIVFDDEGTLRVIPHDLIREYYKAGPDTRRALAWALTEQNRHRYPDLLEVTARWALEHMSRAFDDPHFSTQGLGITVGENPLSLSLQTIGEPNTVILNSPMITGKVGTKALYDHSKAIHTVLTRPAVSWETEAVPGEEQIRLPKPGLPYPQLYETYVREQRAIQQREKEATQLEQAGKIEAARKALILELIEKYDLDPEELASMDTTDLETLLK